MKLTHSKGVIHLSMDVKDPDMWRTAEDIDLHGRVGAEIAAKIKARDQHTCRSCTLSLPKYLEVHHIDNDHTNYSEENLATICPICHSVPHVGLCAMKKRGYLIYMPELTQNQLISMAIWAYLWPASPLCDKSNYDRAELGTAVDLARRYYAVTMSSFAAAIKARKEIADKMVAGAQLVSVAEAIHKSKDKPEIQAQLATRLASLRLMPDISNYPEALRREIAMALHMKVPDHTVAVSHVKMPSGR